MMRAIQVSATGDISVLKQATIPRPMINANQILVQNRFSGINFIDTYHRTGLYKLALPFVPGREGSGVVSEVGSAVSHFAVGDRVCFTASSTYCEYTAVNPEFAIKLPDNVSLETGGGLLLQGLTAIALTRKVHLVEKGQTCLIHAASGGTGQLLVQICKRIGATVIATTSSPEKVAIAKKLGADHVINYTNEDILARVLEITGGEGVDVVYDGVGKSTFDTSLKSLKVLGSMVSFGNASGKVEDIDIMKLVPKCVKLSRPSLFNIVSSGAIFQPLANELLTLVSQGQLKLDLSEIYSFEKVGQAHEDLENKRTTGKILLRI